MFKLNDIVVINHQRDLGEFIVTNPKDETLMTRVDGTYVGYYVRLSNNKIKNIGYHENNLTKV